MNETQLSDKLEDISAADPNVSNSSDLKRRKSSNIFSALMRKARRKTLKNGSKLSKSLQDSVQNLSECSTLSSAQKSVGEEVELQCESYEKKCGVNHDILWTCSETNTSNDSSKTHVKDNFKESSRDYGEMILTSFIYFEKPTLNIRHVDALQYLQKIINSLHESEAYLINLLMKYLADHTAQAEIRNVLSNHTKLQWEAERRSCLLSNEIWAQQVEISRTNQRALQDVLTDVVRQNRHLQTEHEVVYRKCERASKLLKEHKSNAGESQLESVLRHNEKLQNKLEALFKKMECLESELGIFQKQNNTMEDQLREYVAKMQSLKSAFHKMKTDYEIERVSLSIQLDSKERILQEADTVSKVVLSDLDSLKSQFTLFNWTKIEVRENSLADLIHICRACINELAAELVKVNTDTAIKDKDIMALREELAETTKQLETQASIVQEKQLLEQKCLSLEDQTRSSTLKIQELELEKSGLLQNIANTESQLKQLEDKDKMLEQTKMFIANITSENCSLQHEVATLNRILSESGAGDMFKQMEQTDLFKRELDKVKNENTELKAKVENAMQENAVVMANQEMTFKTLQRQIKELERLNEDNLNVRQKLEAEHQTVISLQAERMKYLEDKHMMKTVVQHLKGELSKINPLEDELSNAIKEANKLSFIAEYNKQQGEKLKEEIAHRDSVIAHLKGNIQKMNQKQMQASKEKLNLCQELNEVSQLKEKLNDVLNSEVKKNAELGQSKEQIVKTVSCQMQKIEEKQRHERTAIRVLLNDLKVVAEEKDSVSQEKYKLEMEIEQLKTKLSDQKDKFASLTKDSAIKVEEVKELRKELDRQEKLQRQSKEKLDNEFSKYDYNLKQLKKLIEQLRSENKQLQNSNDYLKNNMEKIQKDLDDARHSHKLSADQLKKTKEELEDARNSWKQQTKVTEDVQKEKENIWQENVHLSNQKDCLIQEMECMNVLIEKVVHDFEENLQAAAEKEDRFKDELNANKGLIHNYILEIRELKQTLELKEKKIVEISDLGNMKELYEKKLNHLKEELENSQLESASFKTAKSDLEVALNDLQDQHNKTQLHLTHLENEFEVLESQLKIVLDQKEDDYMFYKKHLAEISRERETIEVKAEKEISKLHSQLQDINNRLSNEKAAYETLSQIHKEVSSKFLKSIKELVEEKNAKQRLMEQLSEVKTQLEQSEQDKEKLLNKVEELSVQIEDASTSSIKLEEEKSKLEAKCLSLENQIKETQLEDLKVVDNNLQSENLNLKEELQGNITKIHKLELDIVDLQKQISLVQLERSEIVLKLHETEKKLETEKSFGEQLKNTQKLLLAAVIQLKEEGKVDPADCIHLLHMVRSTSHLSSDGGRSEC